MLMILIDAVILIGLLSVFQEEELSMGFAAVIAIVTAIVTAALVYGLVYALGEMGLYLGLILAAVLLGVALSALYGMELKRAIMVAVIFMAVHAVVSYFLGSMIRRGMEVAAMNWASPWLLT
jgi:hypothetical protein